MDQSKRVDKTDQTDHSHWMEYNCQTSLKSSRASCDANKAKSEEVNTSIFYLLEDTIPYTYKNNVMSTKNDEMSTKNDVMSTTNYAIFRKNNVMSTKK